MGEGNVRHLEGVTDINLYHLVKVVVAKSLHFEVSVFPFSSLCSLTTNL